MEDNKGFIDENMFLKNIPCQGMPGPGLPGQGQPAAFVSNNNNLTLEHLNSIINNSNEHPQIRKSAEETKMKLFGKSENESTQISKEIVKNIEENIIEDKPISKPIENVPIMKKSTNKKIEKTQHIDDQSFNNFIQNFSAEIYSDEVALLSYDNHITQLRSMTVEEYKFLSKQLEIFESRNEILDKNAIDYTYQSRLLEFSLTNALDVILKRCITNNYEIENLTIHDWVYLLVYLRLLSRGEEAKFKINVDKTLSYIDINISDMLDEIKSHKDEFCKNPMDYLSIDDDLDIYLMVPTRGDILYIQEECSKDPDASFKMLSLAMCIKAFVKDGVANVMTPSQRIQFFNSLSYDQLRNIKKSYEKNNKAFFNIINMFIHKYNANAQGLNISDFILFFYDF